MVNSRLAVGTRRMHHGHGNLLALRRGGMSSALTRLRDCTLQYANPPKSARMIAGTV